MVTITDMGLIMGKKGYEAVAGLLFWWEVGRRLRRRHAKHGTGTLMVGQEEW